MMAQDGDNDLKEKMAEAEAQMQAKQSLRDLLEKLQEMEADLTQMGYTGTPPTPRTSMSVVDSILASMSVYNSVIPELNAWVIKVMKSLNAALDNLDGE